jgi:hypothetical protein
MMKVFFVGFLVFLSFTVFNIVVAHEEGAALLLQTYGAAVKTCKDYGGLPVEGTDDIVLLARALKGKTDATSQPGFVWLLSDHIYNWAHVYRVSEPHEIVSQAKTQEGWVVCHNDLKDDIHSKIIRHDEELDDPPLTGGRLVLFQGFISLGLLLLPLILGVQFAYKFRIKVSEAKQRYLDTHKLNEIDIPGTPLWRKMLGCVVPKKS